MNSEVGDTTASNRHTATLQRIPSVDEVLKTSLARGAIDRFGRPSVVAAIRGHLDVVRSALRAGQGTSLAAADIAASATANLELDARPKVRPIFNLTGTVLHTNLGRAVLADAAVEAACVAMRQALALEFDLENGRRGERDALIRELLCELTGAEDATVVNNNAAAVLLVLNTLAKGKEAIVSRGELIEIGGAFRMPDIMSRAGTKLVEIGTTNRTHKGDYEAAIGNRTGLVLKVHTSNYRIEGFTKAVPARELTVLAKERGVPLVNDLGSGTLIDLSRYGVSREPMVAEAVADGADLVTFSGDKLLGGPQTGFIVGRKELVAKVNKNPMKRALRVDKIRLAALEATLRLYRDPESIHRRLPVLRMLTGRTEALKNLAGQLAAQIADRLPAADVDYARSESYAGGGTLPTVPFETWVVRFGHAELDAGRLATALRQRDLPIIARVHDDRVVFDCRTLSTKDAERIPEALAETLREWGIE